jgi:hypothetical protein
MNRPTLVFSHSLLRAWTRAAIVTTAITSQETISAVIGNAFQRSQTTVAALFP